MSTTLNGAIGAGHIQRALAAGQPVLGVRLPRLGGSTLRLQGGYPGRQGLESGVMADSTLQRLAGDTEQGDRVRGVVTAA